MNIKSFTLIVIIACNAMGGINTSFSYESEQIIKICSVKNFDTHDKLLIKNAKNTKNIAILKNNLVRITLKRAILVNKIKKLINDVTFNNNLTIKYDIYLKSVKAISVFNGQNPYSRSEFDKIYDQAQTDIEKLTNLNLDQLVALALDNNH